ncbi:hypothetical protein TJA_04340 [Thermus sp. LT1-2-5]|uniref:hemerythrin domain-containing protein n=1 Tax=Thermus sp. LT1-2-5 TaxID=3026935 RepID=UPI0030EA597B
MVKAFLGKSLARPGGRVEVLEVAPGQEVEIKVFRSEDALLVGLKGNLLLHFWQRRGALLPGEVVRLRPGRLTLRSPEGGRALLVTLGVSPERLRKDHAYLSSLLEDLPSREVAEILAQKLEAHIALEEALYYPTFSPGKLKERLLEHRILRELLGELLKTLKEGRSAKHVVERLRTAFLAHAEAELDG